MIGLPATSCTRRELFYGAAAPPLWVGATALKVPSSHATVKLDLADPAANPSWKEVGYYTNDPRVLPDESSWDVYARERQPAL